MRIYRRYVVLGKRKWRRRAHHVRAYTRYRFGKRERVRPHLRRNRRVWRL